GRVAVDGNPVKLTSHEYRLLSYLMHHTGRTLSASQNDSDYPFMKVKLDSLWNRHPICVLCARTGSRRRRTARRVKMTRIMFAMAVATLLMMAASGTSQAAPIAPLSTAVISDQNNVTPVYWYRHRWYHHRWHRHPWYHHRWYRHHRHCWRGRY